MRETQVQSLGWEDPLEKKMATQSSSLAWRLSWTEEPGRLQYMGSQRVGHDWVTSLHFWMKYLMHAISNFPDEISSLSHSIVFLYFFELNTKEVFCISPCHSWNSAFKWVYLSFSTLPLTSVLFSDICEASSDNYFAFCISLSLVWYWLLPTVQCHEPLSIVLQALLSISSYPLNLLVTFTVYKGFYLSYTWMV